MSMFDTVWGYLLILVPIVMGLVSAVVQMTPTTRDDEVWGKVASIIGRVFSVKEQIDPNTGKSSWKLPVVQSAVPKSVRDEKKKA